MSRKQWGYGNVYQRGRVWWVYYSDHGRTIRESSGSPDKSEAEKFLKKKLAAVIANDRSPQGNATVNELLDDLIANYELDGKKSIGWAKIVAGHLRPHFGRWKAAKIGTAQIHAYILERRRKGRSNGTINRELAILRSAFNMALRHDPPKVSRAPFIKELDEPKPRQGFFEKDKFQSVSKHLTQDVRDVALFAYCVGTRKSETLSIQWQQVDLKKKLIRLEGDQTKNGTARHLPITAQMADMLTRRKRERDTKFPESPWVFSRAGQQIKSFKTAWAAACVKAGLVRKDDPEKPEALFHDLRRTAVRNMVRAGVPEKVAMNISGHKTRAIFERYNISDDRDLDAAAKAMERYF